MRSILRILLVITPVILALAIAVVFFILPQLVQDKLAANLRERHGLELTVSGGSGLSVSGGLATTLTDVKLTRPDAAGAPLAQIARITVPTPVLSLFNRDGLRRAILSDAVFTFESEERDSTIDPPAAAPAHAPSKPFDIELRNASLTALDRAHDLTLSVTDISGKLTLADDGSLAAQLRGLFHGTSTTLELAVENVQRLRQKGSPADVRLASGQSQVVLSGRLGLNKELTFDGSVAAESPDLRLFMKLLGLDLGGFAKPAAVALDASLSISKSRASIKNLAFSLENMQGKGAVEIQAASPRPAVRAELAFTSIDLDVYTDAVDQKAGAAPPDLSQSWSEKTFNPADLRALDVDLTLTTEALTAGAVSTGPASMKADLAEGALKAVLTTDAVYGGKGKLQISLTDATPARLQLDLAVENTRAQDFLKQAFGLPFVSGVAKLDANVSAQGQSPAQFISTLAGTARLSLSQGKINGLDIAARAGLVATDDVEGWGISSGQSTVLTDAQASATLREGIASLANTRLTAAGFAADITGDVDLLRRALNVQVRPSTQTGSALPVAISARGPWEAPRLTAKFEADEALRSLTEDGDIEAVAKGAAKKAKKTLKKLFGN